MIRALTRHVVREILASCSGAGAFVLLAKGRRVRMHSSVYMVERHCCSIYALAREWHSTVGFKLNMARKRVSKERIVCAILKCASDRCRCYEFVQGVI